MSDTISPPPPPSTPEPNDAKAQLAAAKAYAKAQRPWFKKKRVLIPGGLLILAAAGAAGSDGNTDGSVAAPTAVEAEDVSPVAEDAAPQQAQLPGIGDEVRDGKFAFTITAIECGATSVGSEFLQEDAQGQFCRMDLMVTNVGDEAQFMHADSQYILDSAGREFSADSGASLVANEGGTFFLEEINPGNTSQGVIYFDVPADVELASARLHDSMFSGGVEVALR